MNELCGICVKVVCQLNNTKRNFPFKKYIKIGWVISIATILVLLYAPYVWVIGPFRPVPGALYASTCQTVWSLALFFIIFACVNGHGGFVNTFLSFKAFR